LSYSGVTGAVMILQRTVEHFHKEITMIPVAFTNCEVLATVLHYRPVSVNP